jgi:glycine/D-amino acid oxidase-like deaminating enzyme
VLVIGAGITGAMIAEALAAAGREVVVVDKRGPANGSTAASTALVQYAIDTPLTQLARKIGKQSAVRAGAAPALPSMRLRAAYGS